MPSEATSHWPGLIRVLTAVESPWSQGEIEQAEKLAAKTFSGVDQERVSVYLVSDAPFEVSVAAALSLRRGSGIRKPATLLRIPLGLASELGISLLDDQLGETGVVSVDATHRDLVGTAAQYVELSRRLLQAQSDGRDMVRQIGGQILHRRFEAFQTFDSSQISDASRKSAVKLFTDGQKVLASMKAST